MLRRLRSTLRSRAPFRSNSRNATRSLIVDCLLPGQVRRMGGQMIYMSPKTRIKPTGSECEIRGEYVAYFRSVAERRLIDRVSR